MPRKVWIALAIEALVFALLLFGAAGTLRWPAAWVYLVLFFGLAVPFCLWLARHDPALLQERMKSPFQKGQPLWDRILLPVLFALFPLWLVLIGLDAVRFGWSAMPAWLQWAGAAALILSLLAMGLVFRENTFLAPVVRIQEERAHRVITTGPYAVVRHPLYTAALVWFAATALMLGSWWGLVACIAFAVILAMRTALEDRELHRGLPGYPDYARRVRHRLVPFVW
ncbi:methyltransferase family protein [Inquilinus limosus]|uniref:methyltransferase family protein n=1 Tax=Inquilinus limosus TaxID=171674 RepID=UPI0003FB94FD|nr:isoprenylcysteine carboxylmethyltransferase family protein [Inquilinus limosus]